MILNIPSVVSLYRGNAPTPGFLRLMKVDTNSYRSFPLLICI